MKTLKGSKVAIIGAGAVGATIAFALSFQQLCSELVLIDVNVDKARVWRLAVRKLILCLFVAL